MVMIGKVAKCKRGIIGVISHRARTLGNNHHIKGPLVYKGVTLNGNKWQSKNPEVIAENLNEYFVQQIEKHEI